LIWESGKFACVYALQIYALHTHTLSLARARARARSLSLSLSRSLSLALSLSRSLSLARARSLSPSDHTISVTASRLFVYTHTHIHTHAHTHNQTRRVHIARPHVHPDMQLISPKSHTPNHLNHSLGNTHRRWRQRKWNTAPECRAVAQLFG